MRKFVTFVLVLIMIVSATHILPIIKWDGFNANEVLAAGLQFDTITETSPEITSLPINELLTEHTPRDGYILAPTLFGRTGIDSQSSFVLRTPADYDTSEPQISIDGQPLPTIAREDNNTFIVTPAFALTSNSVYIFRLTRDGNADVTWAFQTTVRFELTSTLPRHQATNVPVRTGIEISFSFGDYIDIEDHFSIYPHAAGRFIHRDSTAIFMPTSPLQHGQIYTVTISEGISIPETSDVITTDYTFSFETAPEPTPITQRWEPVIHFSNRHVELPSFAPPSVNFRVSYHGDSERPPIDMNVYQIGSRTQAIAAVNRLTEVPSWSRISQEHRFVDTTYLRSVSSTRIVERLDDERGWSEVFSLPSTLTPGFYVLNAVVEGNNNQMIIQVTDLAVQIVADNDITLVWVNDMTTGLPAAGASVHDPVTSRTYETSADGIAIIQRSLSSNEHLIITAADGKQAVAFVHSANWYWDGDWFTGWRRPRPNAHNYYWTALQLDRTLFQRSDTVSFWGFVQNRQQHEEITHVTAVLTQTIWDWFDYNREHDTLHRQNIPVQYGAYSGEIRLPNLNPGSYELAIFHGDVVLSSTYFDVRDYVTPPYRMTVSSNKNAVFAGEEVVFTTKTEFFEGTAVSDLEISYRYSGWGLRTSGIGQNRTDLEGVVEISATPIAENGTVQGERSLSFSAEASLPEIGWVNRRASVRVFINDIHVQARAKHTDGNANLTVNVNDITLDRLNDRTAGRWNGDFLCSPTARQRISVEIVETFWERVRDGEFYCHVSRQVIPRYLHERREREIDRFVITTNSNGVATRDFQIPNIERRNYQARLTTIDGNGRTITQNVFIGRDFSQFHQNANDDRLFLYGVNHSGYDIGDEVELTIMRGAEPVAQGNFLFVVAQNGILSYHVGTNPLTFTFDEQHVPNVQVFAYHFNGHTYHDGWRLSQRLRFNSQTRNLTIDVATCQESYIPGDMQTLTITTTDMEGNPKPANVNISIVDEALFALVNYNVNTLDMLYRNVSDNVRFSRATHRTFRSDGTDDSGLPVPLAPFIDAEGGGETHIRERFEDTAIFAVLRTDAQGEASFTFQLPDNITSWRITASAISDDLYAGNTVQNIHVTQQMFLHYTLNSTFLVGDRPYIGVNAFGASLSGGEQVTFEVWREDAPNDIRRATGVSFERVNIPLWEMNQEGFGEIVIRASAAGYSDAVRHSYQVLNSHHLMDNAIFYEVTPNTVFDVNPGGLTNITFTDLGRGRFLRDLSGMRWWTRSGRIEGLVANREAIGLIRTHFPDIDLFGGAGNFNVLDYQTESGGIAILPHADADLQTTVMLMPFILRDVNRVTLRGYLQNMFESSTTDNRILALYGLAMLGEPVLLDLQQYAMLTDLSMRNVAYIALGFAAIGDMQAARDLYDSRIAPHIQRVIPYHRVYTGTNREDILVATSVTAILAAQLGMPESLGLHTYTVRHQLYPSNFNDIMLRTITRLTFISQEINNHTNAPASITYTLFGETITRELIHGDSFTLRIPAQLINEFNLVSTTGDIGAVSIVRAPIEDIESVENNIIISREFFRAGTDESSDTFEQGELVRVQITIDYSEGARFGPYIVTDFLPAGLVHVSNSARFGDNADTAGRRAWVTTEGQRITFFDFNARFDRVITYHYYARVINPGTFTAEGTIVQSHDAREYFAVGECAVLTINP